MASSPDEGSDYFGFTDFHSYKDFVIYVLSCAPDLFPEEDWLRPEEQMNLDRAFAGLRRGLNLAEQETIDSSALAEGRRLVDDAYALYRAGQNHAGQTELEKLSSLLAKLPSQ
jgi:hypothetical protein